MCTLTFIPLEKTKEVKQLIMILVITTLKRAVSVPQYDIMLIESLQKRFHMVTMDTVYVF